MGKVINGTALSVAPRALDRHGPKQPVRWLGALNFLSFAAVGLSAPYINLYLKSIGFTGTQIGVFISITALLELAMNPVVNAWADRTHRHRVLYRGQVVIIAMSHAVLGLIHFPLLLAAAFMANGSNARANNEMLAQLTITRLDNLKRPIFGKVRMWGSVGWAIAALTSGVLVSLGGYVFAFVASVCVRLLQLPVSQVLPAQITAGDDSIAPDEPMRKGIVVLMISQLIFFVGLNAFGSFIWIHFSEGLGVLPQHIGLFSAFFAITEIIPMLLIDKIIERWGVRRITIIGMTLMAFEWLSFALISSAYWIPFLQIARAMGFSMYTIAISMMVARVSHPSRTATNRALIMVTMPALAMLTTSPLIGWIYDNYGARSMFTFAMIMGLIASVYLVVNYRHLTPYVDGESDPA